MSRVVSIVDYGVGNLMSVARGVERAGGVPKFVDSAASVREADRLILPGVGAFADCRRALERRGVIDGVRDYLASERPALGICVGMQLLFDRSFEFGETPGLGILPGEVRHLRDLAAGAEAFKTPRIGWLRLERPAEGGAEWAGSILDPSAPGPEVYFVHSFACVPSDASHVLATADFAGAPICAAVRRGQLFATQFHPEKSGEAGLAMLRRFLAA